MFKVENMISHKKMGSQNSSLFQQKLNKLKKRKEYPLSPLSLLCFDKIFLL
jgi:hypothetical protein